MDIDKFTDVVHMWLNNMRDKAKELDKSFTAYVIVRNKHWDINDILKNTSTIASSVNSSTYDIAILRESLDSHIDDNDKD